MQLFHAFICQWLVAPVELVHKNSPTVPQMWELFDAKNTDVACNTACARETWMSFINPNFHPNNVRRCFIGFTWKYEHSGYIVMILMVTLWCNTWLHYDDRHDYIMKIHIPTLRWYTWLHYDTHGYIMIIHKDTLWLCTWLHYDDRYGSLWWYTCLY